MKKFFRYLDRLNKNIERARLAALPQSELIKAADATKGIDQTALAAAKAPFDAAKIAELNMDANVPLDRLNKKIEVTVMAPGFHHAAIIYELMTDIAPDFFQRLDTLTDQDEILRKKIKSPGMGEKLDSIKESIDEEV